jgi:hypothetical protein
LSHYPGAGTARLTDQQAKIDALLLEAIDALASLLLSSHHPGNGTA